MTRGYTIVVRDPTPDQRARRMSPNITVWFAPWDQYRIDALWWAYLICWGEPSDARARAFIATELLAMGVIL